MRIAIALFEDAEELDWAGPWEVLADCSWAQLGEIDVLVYPGGSGTRPQLGQERIRERMRSLHAAGTLMTSVCTGALVFADAGLLDGRPATTHWSALELLATLGERIDVRADARFVDDGNIITAAGVSAGIDVALHLVSRLHSRERAAAVRREIQYDPQPPV